MDIRSKIHEILRLIYLLVSACSLPLSVVYLKNNSPETIGQFPGVIIFLIVLGGVFWSVFFVLFGQRYFPFSIKGAILSNAALMGNAFVASRLGVFDFFYGAYSVVFGSLVSLSLYFLVMIVLFLVPAFRHKYFYYTNISYSILLIAGTIFMCLLMIVFSGPAVNEFNSEKQIYWRILYIIIVVFHAGRDLKGYLENNMFQYDPDVMKEKRDEVLTRWGVIIVLVMIAGIMSAMFIAGWDMAMGR